MSGGRDGMVGKIIYAVIALSGYAILACNERIFISPTIAGPTLYVSLALAGARHWFMVRYWPQARAWLCHLLNCYRCLRCDKASGGIKRQNK